MIDIKNILPWILIYSLFFVFSAIFYNQLGAAQFCVIIIMLSFCIFLFKFLSELSNKISLHSETRIYYGTNRELFVPFIGENKVRSEPKKILKSYTIFNIKLFMGFFFMVILVYPLTFILTVIHEFAHAVTGLALGAQILEIRFLSMLMGYTHHSIIPSNIGMSLIYVVGSLSVILSGITLSVLIYRNKNMKLEIFIPIWYAIWHNITGTIDYWYRSVFTEVGDAWGFLTYNLDLIPLKLANFCVLINIVFMFYLLILLGCKIVSRIVLYSKSSIPNLSFLNQSS